MRNFSDTIRVSRTREGSRATSILAKIYTWRHKVIMKKRLIQICSFLSLVLIFTAVSASAQAEYGSEVEIPFSFNAGDRSYAAGKYIVKLNKFQTGSAAIIIGDPRTDSVQTVLARRSGDDADDLVKLVFETINGEKVLSRIITPGGGFALLNRQPRNVAARNREAKAEVVTVSDLF